MNIYNLRGNENRNLVTKINKDVICIGILIYKLVIGLLVRKKIQLSHITRTNAKYLKDQQINNGNLKTLIVLLFQVFLKSRIESNLVNYDKHCAFVCANLYVITL